MLRKVSLLAKTLITPSRRFFSNKYATELKKILSQEIAYEEKEYTPMEQGELNDFLKANGFKLNDTTTEALITLTKSSPEYSITVRFMPRSPPMQAEDENQEEQEPDNYAPFTIILKKTNETKGLLIEAASQESSINVSQVHFSDNIEDFYVNFFNGRSLNTYFGPEFETLDERLQSSFYNWLESLGINEELASFIESYSLDKDQRLYYSWLKDLKSFI